MNINYDRLFIGGRWEVPAIPTAQLAVRNPATGALVGTAPDAGAHDAFTAVTAARRAFDEGPWPRMSPSERREVLDRFGNLLAAHSSDLADLITAEMGSPIGFSRGPQVEHPLAILRHATGWLGHGRRDDNRIMHGTRSLVEHVPVGVVAAITPWNMPLKTIMMKVAPALAAGCTVVVKAAPETPLSALALAMIAEAVDLPHGVLNVITGGAACGAALAGAPGVDKVAFTGSTATGRKIAAVCGGLIRPVSMELGGKSATILCDDANLDAWIGTVLTASLLNNGQICSNQTRILAHKSIYPDVLARLEALFRSLKVGDPTDPGTDVGPLVNAAHAARIRTRLRHAFYDTRALTVVYGGLGTPEGVRGELGTWILPTVVACTDDQHFLWRDELFGPVLAVRSFGDDDQAVRLAENNPYGLHAGVWSADPARALSLARRLRVGQAQVNGAPLGINVPLGGFKASGFGRECGPEGIAGYVTTRAVGLPVTEARA